MRTSIQWILFLETERWDAAFWRRSMCSENPPWRARTPTVRLIMMKVVLYVIGMSLSRCYDSKDDKPRYER